MILRNHELAEEVTQETFTTAYEKIYTLKDPAKFSSWIISIATNKAISLYRRNQKIVPIDEEAVLDYFEQNNWNSNDLSDVLVINEQIDAVKEAVTQLPPKLKEVIILKYYMKLQDQEISKQIGKPVGTVKSSLYRAKKLLAKMLSFQNDKSCNMNYGCGDNEEKQRSDG
jgi:RNA polymerase sigma-70 factor (ECF subfamily)